MRADFSAKFKYLGFIMTCGMVFFHSPIIENVPCWGPIDYYAKVAIDGAIKCSVDLLMSYFFAVTAFLLFRDFSMRDYPTKIKRRVFSLLIPFVLWQLLFTVFDNVFKYNSISVAEFLKSTFLLQRWPVDAALWYVYGIFVMALLSPLVLLIIKRKTLGWVLVLIIILLTEARTKIDIPLFKAVLNYGYVENIVLYFPAYFAGAYYGYHYKDSGPQCLHHLVYALIMAFLLNHVMPGLFSNVSVMLLPIALIYLLPPIRFLENRKIYRLSFIMYALHQPLIWKVQPQIYEFYSNYVCKILSSAAAAALLSRFIVLAVDIGVAALIYYVFSKLSPRFLALLTGGRG